MIANKMFPTILKTDVCNASFELMMEFRKEKEAIPKNGLRYTMMINLLLKKDNDNHVEERMFL